MLFYRQSARAALGVAPAQGARPPAHGPSRALPMPAAWAGQSRCDKDLS